MFQLLRMNIVWPNGAGMNTCPTASKIQWRSHRTCAGTCDLCNIRCQVSVSLLSSLITLPTKLRNSFSDIHLTRIMMMIMVDRAAAVKKKFPQFRILVVGRANAGKTTLLQRVCNTTESPIVRDRNGNEVTARLLCRQ